MAAVVADIEDLVSLRRLGEHRRAGRTKVVRTREEFGMRLQVRFDVGLLRSGDKGGRQEAGGQEKPFHHDCFLRLFSLHSTGVQP